MIFKYVLAHTKDIVGGIIVTLSFVGALYGSFKPETDARETYKVLAPEVDILRLQQEAHAKDAELFKLQLNELKVINNFLIGLLKPTIRIDGPDVARTTQAPSTIQLEQIKPIPVVLPPPIQRKPREGDAESS